MWGKSHSGLRNLIIHSRRVSFRNRNKFAFLGFWKLFLGNVSMSDFIQLGITFDNRISIQLNVLTRIQYLYLSVMCKFSQWIYGAQLMYLLTSQPLIAKQFFTNFFEFMLFSVILLLHCINLGQTNNSLPELALLDTYQTWTETASQGSQIDADHNKDLWLR